MIIATAGHIDHGKTALVRALTGVDTDRLPEEKARGISIDLGFAYLKQADGPTLGFVDVPGHERFIRNMLSGVCAVDYVVLVVAADDGPMPQTVEHLQIVDLLGVGRGLVALTKADKVPDHRLREVSRRTRELLANTGLADAEIASVSAQTGAGIAGLRERLISEARALQRRRLDGQHFRYIVDRAFSMAGSGTVATGVVVAGEVAIGDRLLVSPAGQPVRVRAIQQHGEPVERCQAGERCALNLAGIELAELARGDWVVAPDAHRPTERVDVRVRVLDSEQAGLRHGAFVHVHIGAALASARLAMTRSALIPPGSSARIQLRLDRPISAVHGERFILRDPAAGRTIGGGAVIDPFAPARRQALAERMARLEALDRGNSLEALAALLETSPLGVDSGRFAAIFNLRPERLSELLDETGAVTFGKEPCTVFAPKTLAALGSRLVSFLERFHVEHAQVPGAEAELLRRTVASALDPGSFTLILKRFAGNGAIELLGSQVRLPGYDSTANPRDRKVWQLLAPLFHDAGFQLLSVRELAAATRVPEKPLREFLHRKTSAGGLVRVTPERFATPVQIARLSEHARNTARQAGGAFTAAQFRDRIGTGRGLAIEVLECLDRLGVTVREGNLRRCREEDDTLGTSRTKPQRDAQNTEGMRIR